MEEKNRLYILWTNADPDTSLHMVMMYATNSKIHRWWEHVTVILWGAPARLAAENAQIQEAIRVAQNAGVAFTACVACARRLGVAEQLEAQGIEVTGWGQPLTALLKDNEALLTV